MASDQTIKSLEINIKRNAMKSQARIRITKIEIKDRLVSSKELPHKNYQKLPNNTLKQYYSHINYHGIFYL